MVTLLEPLSPVSSNVTHTAPSPPPQMVDPPGADAPGAPVSYHQTHPSTDLPPPPPAHDAPPGWDRPPALHDDLPGYTQADNERFRRKSISHALWEEHRRHEIALVEVMEQDRRERLERQRTRESYMSQRAGLFDRWIRWSAKFYMPLMNRWGEHRTHTT